MKPGIKPKCRICQYEQETVPRPDGRRGTRNVPARLSEAEQERQSGHARNFGHDLTKWLRRTGYRRPIAPGWRDQCRTQEPQSHSNLQSRGY